MFLIENYFTVKLSQSTVFNPVFLIVHRYMLMRTTLARVVLRIVRPQAMLEGAWHVESSALPRFKSQLASKTVSVLDI